MGVRAALVVSAGLALAAPTLPVQAQPTGKVARVGYLLIPRPGPATAAFRDAMRELGYVEGRNLVLELRSADGRSERLPQLANELVALGVDVIAAAAYPAILAAKQATTTIPIVVGSGPDLLETGLVASPARPGGNITGMSGIGAQITGKPSKFETAVNLKTAKALGITVPETVLFRADDLIK